MLTSHHHEVTFYDHDADLIAELTGFVLDGVARGEGVVVVATAEHRRALDEALAQAVRLPGGASGRAPYVAADAAETLTAFMANGSPDRGRFFATVGGLLDQAASTGRGLRVFGEMVTLLWESGNVPGAIDLERLWNGFARVRDFSLLCGYSTSALADRRDLRPVRDVCQLHSAVLPPDSYTSGAIDLGRSEGLAERSATFVPVPVAIRAVRLFVSNTLLAWGEGELVPDASVVVSELASNAVRHAASPFRVSVMRAGGAVKIMVEDVGPAQPELLAASPDRLGGRGVALIAQLSERWGCEALPDGKVVWSELATRRASAAS